MSRKWRVFATDEELGKRDDDHKKRNTSQWLPAPKLLIRKRRIVMLLVAAISLWILRSYLPSWSSTPFNSRSYFSSLGSSVKASLPEETPPEEQRSSELDDAIPHDFEGPIKFFNLAPSLHQISHTMGHQRKNKNIMFAASDLKSAAAILPLACEMARWGRNYVHMAMMGREEISIEDIKRVNGAEESACNVYWHDARPDYGLFRTDKSMETSVAGAVGHLETFVHPQAFIVADSDHEDYFFSKAVRAKTKQLRQTLIEIPRERANTLSWMTRLEAESLRSWHTALIDIVVQAPAESSGSIIRLLQSLEQADYDGFIPPRLTVEIPHKINDATKKFLDRFDWPPRKYELLGRDSQFVLRRRIPEKRDNAEFASLRFIESFYPSSAGNSHVLVLSPQAELSPIFFHYLKFYLLDYRYSSLTRREDPIIGISLESPSVFLNGSGPFAPDIPKLRPAPDADAVATPYLWQAPNSNAALYFSDRWIELHSFLSRHTTATNHPLTKRYHTSRSKVVSTKFPAWMELFLDLMRARGYAMLYPSQDPDSTTTVQESLVIVHNELYQPPEEFLPEPTSIVAAPSLPTETLLTAEAAFLETHSSPHIRSTDLNQEHPLLQNFVRILTPSPNIPYRVNEGAPPPNPPIDVLPLLDHHGDGISHHDLAWRGADVTIEYRQVAGGCSAAEAKENAKHARLGTAEDLFCLEDDVLGEQEPEEAKPERAAKRPEPVRQAGTKVSDRAHGVDGAAGSINMATNPDKYRETAAAAFKAKLAGGKDYEYAAHLVSGELALTDAEKAELEDWKRKQAKETGLPIINDKAEKEASDLSKDSDSGAQPMRRPGPVIGKVPVREAGDSVREEPDAGDSRSTSHRAFPDEKARDTGNTMDRSIPLSKLGSHAHGDTDSGKQQPNSQSNPRVGHIEEVDESPRVVQADRQRKAEGAGRPVGIIGKMPVRYDEDDGVPLIHKAPIAGSPDDQRRNPKAEVVDARQAARIHEEEAALAEGRAEPRVDSSLPLRSGQEADDSLRESIAKERLAKALPPKDAVPEVVIDGRPRADKFEFDRGV